MIDWSEFEQMSQVNARLVGVVAWRSNIVVYIVSDLVLAKLNRVKSKDSALSCMQIRISCKPTAEIFAFVITLTLPFFLLGKTDYFLLARAHYHIFAQANRAESQDRRRGVALSQFSIFDSDWYPSGRTLSCRALQNHVDLNSTNGRHTLQSNDPSV